MISIGNAQGFWGDRDDAAAELLQKNPTLDYLTLDYLAELSLSIMAIQKQKDPSLGYAKDFFKVIESIIPFWKNGSKVKIVTNAGGLNPRGCAEGVKKILQENGIEKQIGIVYGDDVLEFFPGKKYTTANAYLGAAPCVEALQKGAEIVITGRVADPSLTVAPAVYEFGWKEDDWNKIASATLAGHLIECGPQLTGGIATHWLELPDPSRIDYPVVTIDQSGEFKVSGNHISLKSVKEQLLYEIGDPSRYLSPDVTVSLMDVVLSELPNGYIGVKGVKGSAPTVTYKVSATCPAGYKCEGTLVIVGKNAVAKARKSGQILIDRIKPLRSHVEVIGAGDLYPGLLPQNPDATEVVLRVAAADPDPKKLELFAKQFAPFVTSGPPGTTGYSGGRPKVRPQFAYHPELIEKRLVKPQVELLP